LLAEGAAHRVLRTHSHVVDQFQSGCKGDGATDKHPVGFGAVRFSRAPSPV